jgi:hypothetical protein
MRIIDAYAAATCLSDKTISHRVFKDTKKVNAVRQGGDITTSRLDEAVVWFSDNWPVGAEWPKSVERPARQTVEAAE